MIRPALLAATAACLLGTTLASAHTRDDRHHRHGHAHARHFWVTPSYAYRPYAPYWAYEAPAFAYPRYEPAPVIVERVYEYERPRVYEAPPRPVEPRYGYEERSYAQVVPPEPPPPPVKPLPPAKPAPRLERYTLSAKELFGFDEATIRKPHAKLDEIAEVMTRNPQIDRVTITGYTDRIGSDAYNLKLSQRRANAVKSYLVERGVAASRLTAVGKGKANPVVQCNDKDRAKLIRCLEPNRRVEVEQITIERQVR